MVCRNMGQTSTETGLSKTWQFQFREICGASSLLTQNYGKKRVEITQFTKLSWHGQRTNPMDKLYCRDKVLPREVKPCLLALETDEFSILGQPNVKLVFPESDRRVKADLALPASL